MCSADELVKSTLSPPHVLNERWAIVDQKIQKPTRPNRKNFSPDDCQNQMFEFVVDQSLSLGKRVSLGLKHSTKTQLMQDLGQGQLSKEFANAIHEYDPAPRLPRRNSSTIIKVSSTSDFSDSRDNSSRGTSSRGTSSRGTSTRGSLTWAATPNRSGLERCLRPVDPFLLRRF